MGKRPKSRTPEQAAEIPQSTDYSNEEREAIGRHLKQSLKDHRTLKVHAPDLSQHTGKLDDLRKSAASGVTAALRDLKDSPVTEESFRWLRQQTKNFNLRLRLKDGGDGNQPAVKLSKFENGTVVFTTIEAEERELLRERWPELEVFEIASGRGNASIAIFAGIGGKARMAKLDEDGKSELGKLAAKEKGKKS